MKTFRKKYFTKWATDTTQNNKWTNACVWCWNPLWTFVATWCDPTPPTLTLFHHSTYFLINATDPFEAVSFGL